MNKILKFEYTEKEKKRIDKYLSNLKNEELYSRSFIDKLIKQGLIKVNNKRCKKNFKLTFGDKIEIIIPPKQEIEITPLKIDLKIVYEDEFLVVINKPSGLTVHPAPGHYNDTLVNALVYHYKKNLSNGYNELRPGIVHRLDKNTSGLLIIAKDDKTHLQLSKMFHDKKIKKIYRAITVNVPQNKKGSIRTLINRDKRDRKKFAVSNSGRESITHYKILKDYEFFSYLEIELETGRTHQIRIHLNYINCPILGDEVYNSQKKTLNQIPLHLRKKVKALLKNHLNRQALHSYSLEFEHPITKKKLVLFADLPEDMKYTIDWLETNFSPL